MQINKNADGALERPLRSPGDEGGLDREGDKDAHKVESYGLKTAPISNDDPSQEPDALPDAGPFKDDEAEAEALGPENALLRGLCQTADLNPEGSAVRACEKEGEPSAANHGDPV